MTAPKKNFIKNNIPLWSFLAIFSAFLCFFGTPFLPEAQVINTHNYSNPGNLNIPKSIFLSNFLNQLFKYNLPVPSLNYLIKSRNSLFLTPDLSTFSYPFIFFLTILTSFYKESLTNFDQISNFLKENQILSPSKDFKVFNNLYLNAASTKNISDFNHFYTFYLSQHEDLTSRRLHIIGTTIFFLLPILISSYYLFINRKHDNKRFGLLILIGTPINLFLSMLVGNFTFHLTRHLSHGIIEMASMFIFFLISMKQFTGSWKPALFMLVNSYAFAWVGHFFFEGNRPATFVYPLYSLLGDFRLWVETATGQRSF